MNERQKKEQTSEVRDREIRAALDQHWAASDANDLETEHRIYHEDAVLEYPQSGERTRGRRNIQNQRASQLSKKRFAVRRIIGGGDLWVTEFILKYDGKPSYAVSIMEFRDDKVVRETQYFADPHSSPPHGALNGSNGWTHNRREQRLTPKARLVLPNAVSGEVELYRMGGRNSPSSDGRTRDVLERPRKKQHPKGSPLNQKV